jgi:RNA-binding protein YlmH
MNKEFIPYEQALELKELGFDEACMAFYEPGNKEVKVVGVNQRYNDPSLLTVTDFCAPLYQQAFRWFREKYDLHVSFGRLYDTAETKKYVIDTYNEICSYEVDYSGGHSTYEEAELACLKKLIEIVKNK